MLGITLLSCSEEERTFPTAASLKVVHAASGAPAVHINYFGPELENLNFSKNRELDFGASQRFTIRANQPRNLKFTYESDTTREVYNEDLVLEPGEILTYFLLGDSANLTSSIIVDEGHQVFSDSSNAVRFLNMAEGVDQLNVGILESSVQLSSGLAFSQASEFILVDATLQNPNYVFTFKSQEDSTLATFNFSQYLVSGSLVFTRSYQRNATFALIGKSDDGEGNSTLQVVQINNF